MMLREAVAAVRRFLPLMGVGIIVIAVGAILGVSFYLRGQTIMERELKDKLRITAAMAALQFDSKVIDALHGQKDMGSARYKTIVNQLNAVRESGPNIRYAYLMRKTSDPLTLVFVADADSLFTDEELDARGNGNGTVDDDEEASYPGDAYDIADIPALLGPAFEKPTVDEDITVDAWGQLISGYAPIFRPDGTVAAVLGIDMVALQFRTLSQSIFSPVALLLVLLSVFATGVYAVFSVWNRRQEMLRRIAEERTGLMRLTFHQLGTPITILKWSLEQLQESSVAGAVRASIADYFVSMEDAIARLDAILRALKNADRIAENTLEYVPRRCGVNSIVDDAVNGLQPRLRQRKQDLTIHGDRYVHVAADCNMTAAVLHELVDNAIRYSKPGTPIDIGIRQLGSFVQIAVTDKGIGIPDKDKPRIFERFVRGSNAGKMHPDGSGLGLYIAKGIVERAGGTMSVLSRVGAGTTISFTLPTA
jgi:signal transduction histidine kinase